MNTLSLITLLKNLYHWKKAVGRKTIVIIPLILIGLDLFTGSILIFLPVDNREGAWKELGLYTIPRMGGNNSTDFVVEEAGEAVIQDRVFTSSGDIIVESGGALILLNAEVIFPHTGCFEHGIILKENTTLEIHHSQIKGVNNLFFFKAQNTRLIIADSKIRMTHIICGNSSRISIARSDLWALHCFNESKVNITNARLHYLFLRGRSSARVDDSNIVEVLLYDNSKASISDTALKNIFYFDRGSSTLTKCSYIDLIRFEPKLCCLTITVLDKVTQDPVPMINVSLSQSKGYRVASSATNENGTVIFRDLEEGDYIAEIEEEGYVPVKIRIALLNDIQNETLKILRTMDQKSNSFHPNLYLSILLVITLLIIALYFYIKVRSG